MVNPKMLQRFPPTSSDAFNGARIGVSFSDAIVAPYFVASAQISALENEGYESDREPPLTLNAAAGAPYKLSPGNTHVSSHVPSIISSNSTSATLSKTQRNNLKNRLKRRQARLAQQTGLGTTLKDCAIRHRHAALQMPEKVRPKLEAFTPTKPAWVNKLDKSTDKKEYTLDDILDNHNMKYIDWRGRATRPFADSDSKVIGLLGGIPTCPEWDELHVSACKAIAHVEPHLQVAEGDKIHRRGAFPAFQMGLTHGNGRKEPGMRQHTQHNLDLITPVFQHAFFQRVSGFATGLLNMYAPRLHDYYQDTIDRLMAQNPDIYRIYEKCAFASATINFGPRTVSYPHLDYANLAWGMCAITAMGDFDPDAGGHLVLWDLGCIIRFPPGSTILIPSAMVKHSNTCVAEGEQRYSFVQYSAGGLFRWVHNEFTTDAKATEGFTKEQHAARVKANEARWKNGLGMLSSLSELKAY